MMAHSLVPPPTKIVGDVDGARLIVGDEVRLNARTCLNGQLELILRVRGVASSTCAPRATATVRRQLVDLADRVLRKIKSPHGLTGERFGEAWDMHRDAWIVENAN